MPEYTEHDRDRISDRMIRATSKAYLRSTWSEFYVQDVALLAAEREKLAAAELVLADRGWRCPGSPPLADCLGTMLDLIENLQRSQSDLRNKLLAAEEERDRLKAELVKAEGERDRLHDELWSNG